MILKGKKCITGILKGAAGKSIACPECKAVTNISHGLDALMVNWAVKKALNNQTPISSATSSAPLPSTPSCQTHKVQASLYCGNCRIYICTECLGSHTGHIGRIGPLDAGKSGFGKQVHAMRSRVANRIREFDDKIGEWEALKEKFATAREPQDDMVLALVEVISLLQQKLDAFKGKLDEISLPIDTKIMMSIQALRASKATFVNLSEKLRNTSLDLKPGTLPDLTVVSESDSALARFTVPSEPIPSLDSVKLVAMKYGPIERVAERVRELEMIPIPLPVSMHASDELSATFTNVSSIRGYVDSESVKFGKIELYEP